MKKSDFYYHLPDELIAQTPIEPRNHSRLLLLNKSNQHIEHSRFYNLKAYLKPGDCLILNDTRVLPARLYGTRIDTNAVVEFVLLTQRSADIWEVLAGPGKKAKPGCRFDFGNGLLQAEIIDVLEGGNRLIKFSYNGNFYNILDEIGQMPLPHYIKQKLDNKERYQTVYSKQLGSAAAPTAGLHFTLDMLDELKTMGIKIGYVTLHVGLGTFRPVKSERIEEHKMHSEHYYMPKVTADLINDTKQRGGRVICVGTTSCRTVETVASLGEIKESSGDTGIFIYPGYKFKCMDALITNFHLPESTLIMLVAAFAGLDNTMNAYKTAVQEKYRFYSFGDAMFIY